MVMWWLDSQRRPPANESTCYATPPATPLTSLGVRVPAKDPGGYANDCAALDSERGDLEYASFNMIPGQEMTLLPNGTARENPNRKSVKSVITTRQPSWSYPPCGDVPDLSVRNPLAPCKKLTGDEASRLPTAHRPKVLSGYGVPLIYRPHSH